METATVIATCIPTPAEVVNGWREPENGLEVGPPSRDANCALAPWCYPQVCARRRGCLVGSGWKA